MSEAEIKENFFDTVEEAIESFKAGECVLIADDEDRENEGDLICSAQTVTPEIINFMAASAAGLCALRLHRKKLKSSTLRIWLKKTRKVLKQPSHKVLTVRKI